MYKSNKRVQITAILGVAFFAVLILLGAVFFIPPATDNVGDETSSVANTLVFPDITGYVAKYFSNGYKYRQDTADGIKYVTVNSSATAGTETNPIVIDNAQGWALLADLCSKGVSLKTRYFVLGNDIDATGYYLPTIGSGDYNTEKDTGDCFNGGHFYGQGHVIKNATFKVHTDVTNRTNLAPFGYAKDAVIAGVGIDPSCKFEYEEKVTTTVGGIAAQADGCSFYSCYNYAKIDFRPNFDDTTIIRVGGIVGMARGGNNFYRCGNRADIYAQQGNYDDMTTDNVTQAGGFIGGLDSRTGYTGAVTIENCYSIGIYTAVVGPNLGGLIGRISGTIDGVNIKNVYLDVRIGVRGHTGDNAYLVSIGVVVPLTIENVYMTGSETHALYDSYTNNTITNTNWTRSVQDANITNLHASGAAMKEAAKAVLDNSIWSFDVHGTPVLNDEPTQYYTVNFEPNGGALPDGVPSTMEYANNNQASLNKNVEPTRAGYTFTGWHLGSLSGPIITGFAVGEYGEHTIYASWTLNAPTLSVTGGGNIAYGQTATLTASASHTLSGLTYRYAWYKKDGDSFVQILNANGASLPQIGLDIGTHTYKCESDASDGTYTSAAASTEVTVTVGKATPTLTKPTRHARVYYIGQKVGVVAYSSGEATNPYTNEKVAGRFTWQSPNTVMKVFSADYTMLFTPTDTTRYNTNTVAINVKAAQLYVTFNSTIQGTTTEIGKVAVDYGSTLAAANFPTIPTVAGYTGAYSVTQVANITENKTVDVAWTLNAPTGSIAGGGSYGYGKEITLTASAGHAAASGITYAYQWSKKGADGTYADVSGGTAAALKPGGLTVGGYTYKCTITASDGTLTSAVEKEAAVTVTKATPTLTLPTVNGTYYVGQRLSVVTLTGGSAANANNNAAVAGTFAWQTPNTTLIASGDYTVVFTPTDTTNYSTNTATINVKATQLYVTFNSTIQGTTTEIEKVKADYGSTLAAAKFPTIPTVAGYTGKYAETQVANITENKTVDVDWTLDAPTGSITGGGSIVYGSDVTLTAAAGHAAASGITYTYQWSKKGADGTYADVSGGTSAALAQNGLTVGTHTYKCTITAGDGTLTSAVDKETAVTVTKATPTLTAPTVTGTYCVGQDLSAVTFTDGSAINPTNNAAVAGAFAWQTPDTVLTASGSYVLVFTPTDTDNYSNNTVSIDLTAEQLYITFNADFNGTVTELEKRAIAYGADIAGADFPEIPTVAGYTGAYPIAELTNITESKTVTATYTANTDTAYTTEYYLQNADGTYPTDPSETVVGASTTDTTVSAEVKTYEHYTLDRENASAVTGGTVTGDGKLTLKLYYKRDIHTVDLDLRGGTGESRKTALWGAAVERPTDPTREGYTFAGFYTEQEYATQWHFAGSASPTPLNGDVTLYAKWEARSYRISYTLNRIVDGVKEINETLFTITAATNPASYTISTPTFALAEPTAEGYDFLGWYDGAGTRMTRVAIGTSGDLELEARWKAKEYVIAFNADGGKVTPGAIVVTNMKAYGELPVPTKSGYVFGGWFTAKEGGVQVQGTDTVVLKGAQTLYARWNAEEYSLALDDLKGSTMTVRLNGQEVNYWEVLKVNSGDILNIKVTPAAGYAISRLTIAGRTAVNGGNYIVKSGYANKTITVKPALRTETYTITYYLNGGTQGVSPTGAWARTYTVESADIELPPIPLYDETTGEFIPDEAYPTKTGYEFGGWFLDPDMTNGIETITTGSYTGDLALYAYWLASEQTLSLKGNYSGAPADQIAQGYTDEKITLPACSFASEEARADFRFLGWSTTPNGSVEYEEGAEYTMKASGNTLYAVWHIANIQFVTINAKNDKMIYGSNEEGIVLTPEPGYPYRNDEVTLTYTWYKLDGNGVYAPYGESVTITAAEAKTAAGRLKVSITIKNVADSGSFKCVMKAAGKTEVDAIGPDSKPIQMVTTTEGEGTRTVSMEKAVYDAIVFDGAAYAYDGTAHSVAVANADAMPEGITVSYRIKGAGDETSVGGNSSSQAGIYEVTAIFNVPDKSNYKAIDSRTATLMISPKRITGVTFIGAAADDPTKFDYVYSGMPYTVTAQLQGVLDGDDVKPVLQDNSYISAGSYVALMTGIEGKDSANYEVDPSMGGVSRQYNIAKAVYDVSAVSFTSKTVTFNGSPQYLHLSGAGLPSGVSVTYSYVYTPFNNIAGGSGSGNGGTNAGYYTITASFTGDYENYETIAPKSATLTVAKADYSINYGDFRSSTVSYGVDKNYDPVVSEAALAGRITASYDYYKSVNGIYESMVKPSAGLHDAGVYKITAQFAFVNDEDVNNYNALADKTISYTISSLDVDRLEVTVHSTATYKVGDTFDTDELTVTAYYKDGTSELLDASRYTISPSAFDTAGRTTITVTYSDKTSSFDINVARGDYDMSAAAVGNTLFTYDGAGKVPEVTGLPEGVSAVYTYLENGSYVPFPQGGLINAGEYTVQIGFTHTSANHNDIAEILGCTMTIGQKEISAQFTLPENAVYNGGEYSVTVTANGVADGDTVRLTLTGGSAVHAGSYTATAALDGALYPNYKLSEVGSSVSWDVAPKTVGIKWNEPATPYTYNGAEQTVTAEATDENGNAIEGISVAITFGKDVIFLNAGNYTAQAAGIVNADGTENTDYALGEAGLTHAYKISPKTVSAVWETADEAGVWHAYDSEQGKLVYNGAALDARLRAGFYDGETYIALTVDLGGKNFVNADTYAVTAAASDTDTANNYDIKGAAADVTIAARQVSAVFLADAGSGESLWVAIGGGNTVTYAKREYDIRAYFVNAAGGETALTVTIAQNGNVAAFLNAGSYDVSAAFSVEDGNYALTGAAITATISPKTITATWTDAADMGYDGTEKTVTAELNGVETGDTVTIAYTGNKATHAGKYTASAALNGADAANYALDTTSAEHAYEITARAVTVTISDASMVYNGGEPTAEALAAIGYTVTVGSVISGDDLGVTFAKAAGTDAGVYAITGSASNTDYSVTFAGGYETDGTKGKFTIEQAEPTVNAVYAADAFAGDTALYNKYLKTTEGDTAGNIAFTDLTAISGMTAGTYAFEWKFTPTDSVNYKEITGSIDIEVKAVVAVSISVTATGENAYLTGYKFDPTGYAITLTYNNKSTKDVTNLVEFKIGGEAYDTHDLALTDNKVTVIYDENGTQFTAEISITVTDKRVTGLTVETAPNKVQYVEGQSFDATGLTLRVTFQDNSYTIITEGWILTAPDKLKTTDTDVVAEYGGKKVYITIAVAALEVEKLELVTSPDKTEYIEGNSFDATGLAVKAIYNDGSETYLAISDIAISDAPLALGDTHTTISYTFDGKTVTLDVAVTVKAKSIVSITVTTPPTKTEYNAFESFDPTGMKVTAAYDNGTSGEITDYTTDAPEKLTVDVTKITITAGGGATAEISVSVLPIDYVLDLTFEDKTVSYDGNAHGIAVEGTLPEDVSVLYYVNNAEIGAESVAVTAIGEYTVRAVFTVGDANYKPIADMTAVLTVSEKKMYNTDGLSVDIGGEAVYKGSAFSPAATGSVKDADGNELTLEAAGITAQVTIEREGTITEMLASGTYTVKLNFTHTDAEYEQIGELTFNITIAKAKLTLTADDKTMYEGAATPEFTYTLSGFVGTDTAENVTFGGTAEITTDYTGGAAGSYTLSVDSTLTADNYEIECAGGTLTVEEYVDSIVFEDAAAVYDGEEHGITATNLPEGVTVTYEIADGKTIRDVGTYTITATFTVEGGAYTIKDKTATFTVTAREISLDWNGMTDNVYDGTEKSVSADMVGAVDGDEITLEYDGNAAIDAGMYRAYAALAGADSGNYTLAAASAEYAYEIAQRTLSAEIGNADELIASGAELTPNIALDGVIEGEDAGMTVRYDRSPIVDAGSYTAYVTISNTNYALESAELTFKVLARSIEGELPDAEGSDSVVIGKEDGLDPDTDIVVTIVTDKAELDGFSSLIEGELDKVYDIDMVSNGATVAPDKEVTVKLLVTDTSLFDKNLRVVRYDEDGGVTVMDAARDGDYMVFKTDKLGRFAFVGDAEKGVPTVVIASVAMGAVVAVLLVVMLGVLLKIKRRAA